MWLRTIRRKEGTATLQKMNARGFTQGGKEFWSEMGHKTGYDLIYGLEQS